jgi:hypothetical protein
MLEHSNHSQKADSTLPLITRSIPGAQASFLNRLSIRQIDDENDHEATDNLKKINPVSQYNTDDCCKHGDQVD